jgi:hypothetical protein
VDLVGGVYARAVDIEAVAREVPEQALGHLTPRGVVGA